MATEKSKSDKTRTAGASRRKSSVGGRTRSAGAARSGGIPRIMIIAAVVVVVGGLALFWPRGGSRPAGIGERQTTVTIEGDSVRSQATGRKQPRSGDVDIDQQVHALVPEQADDGSGGARNFAADPHQAAAAQPGQIAPPTTPATSGASSERHSRPVEETAGAIKPVAAGPYVVQLGSFGIEQNADREAARLQSQGWDARVRSGNNSSGRTVYRVWIGYFATRHDAQSFIAHGKQHLADAIAIKH